MNNRNIAFAGAALLAMGVFAPIVTLPILGSVNLLSGFYGYLILGLAALSVWLAFKDRKRDLIWTGGAAAGVVLYAFVRLQYMIASMRESMTKELEGNPFAGFAQLAVSSVQLQWGWLPIGIGAALLIYSALKTREEGASPFAFSDSTSKVIAAVSLVMLAVGPATDILKISGSPISKSAPLAVPATDAIDGKATAANSSSPSAEEAAYIANHLTLYDLTAGYQDTYSGRQAGVNFKIKNNGNRTLNKVKVRVEFFDAQGNAIGEEEYTPVLVSEYNFNDNNPLRPHYIYQQEPDKFWVAENVPSEWAEGKAQAKIVEIEFAPAG